MICRLPLLLLLLLSLAACVTAPPIPHNAVGRCLAVFADIDREVARAGVRDRGPVSIDGFPYLRANRFLASFGEQPLTSGQFAAWVDHLADLDADAREFELRNLSAEGQPSSWQREPLQDCRQLLVENLLSDTESRQQLRAAVDVPDDYVTAWRVAGLYPLVAPFVSLGVDRWQDESRELFAMPPGALPVSGQLQRWSSVSRPEKRTITIRQDPLGIPLPAPEQEQYLLRRHAPLWEVDVVDDNDLPGAAVWRAGPAIDTAQPTQYELVSYTRFGQHVLMQLNYVIWFRARPGDDIYAGRLDGLVWRVTLGPDGEPWLYDSIHNCGCYHTFIPSQQLRLRDDLPTLYFEPPLAPQRAPEPPLVLRVNSGSHYLQRVYTASAPELPGNAAGSTDRSKLLQVENYDRLRSLPHGKGHRSLFSENALVDGTERGERFLLWPMGVRSAGAMRQWGHHPVAFVGRRHFDDARLIEALFQRAD